MAARKRKPKSNVLSLYGAIPAHGVPDPEMVDQLKVLLALAENGAIGGLIIGWSDSATNHHTTWCGAGPAHHLIALSAQLHHRIIDAWNADHG